MADSDRLIVEPGMDVDMSIVDEIKSENADDGFVQYLEEPKYENQDERDLTQDLKDDAPAGDEKPSEENQDSSTDDQKAPDTDGSFELTVKGETRKYTAQELKSALGRQNKMNEVLNSDEYKMGLLMKAAKSGDRKAQKALQEQLIKFSGAEDAEGMLDSLQDEVGEFDADKQADEEAKRAEFDAYFDDVKDSVDYQTNLAKIDTDLKPYIPEKLFNQFFADPEDRRTLYDLAASGTAPQLISAFNQFVGTLSPEKQLEVKTDRDSFVQALELTVKQMTNAAKAAGGVDQGENDDSSDLDAVSTKASSRTANRNSSGPDWENMSDEEFNKYQIKMGLNPT